MAPQTLPVDSVSDIFTAYLQTPLEWLLRYHNLGEKLPPTGGRAQLLVGMCMDDRKDLCTRAAQCRRYVWWPPPVAASGGRLR